MIYSFTEYGRFLASILNRDNKPTTTQIIIFIISLTASIKNVANLVKYNIVKTPFEHKNLLQRFKPTIIQSNWS